MQYLLKTLNVDKIPKISGLEHEFDLVKGNAEWTCPEWDQEFASKYRPNYWRTKDVCLEIYVFNRGSPIQIRSTWNAKPITTDPNFDLIKRIVNLLECKTVTDAASSWYDITIFKAHI